MFSPRVGVHYPQSAAVFISKSSRVYPVANCEALHYCFLTRPGTVISPATLQKAGGYQLTRLFDKLGHPHRI